jgi:hypothetical protein
MYWHFGSIFGVILDNPFIQYCCEILLVSTTRRDLVVNYRCGDPLGEILLQNIVVLNLWEKFCCEISLWSAGGRAQNCVAFSDRHWGISLMSVYNSLPCPLRPVKCIPGLPGRVSRPGSGLGSFELGSFGSGSFRSARHGPCHRRWRNGAPWSLP